MSNPAGPIWDTRFRSLVRESFLGEDKKPRSREGKIQSLIESSNSSAQNPTEAKPRHNIKL